MIFDLIGKEKIKIKVWIILISTIRDYVGDFD